MKRHLISAADLTLPPPAEGSRDVAARVARARGIQRARFEAAGLRTNAEAEGELLDSVAKPDAAAFTTVTRRAPRQVRMFTTPTQITFVDDPVNERTIIELIAGDRPGLLSQVAKVFMNERVEIYTSKIMTVGERAEDVFYVTGEKGSGLGTAARERLAAQLSATLDRRE